MAAIPSQTSDNLLRAAPEEEQTLERLRLQINDIFRRRRTARLIDPDGKTTEIPESVFNALKLLVASMARGQTITLVPHDRDLTTQQAADLLGVSRPHLVKLLDHGVIPHHRVGAHRRVSIEDLLAYRERRRVTRRKKLDELTRLSEELPGGYR